MFRTRPNDSKDLREPISEHNITLHELCKRLNTNIANGLTAEQVDHNLQQHGQNIFTPRRELPEIFHFIKTLFLGFSILLWIAAGLCLAVYIINSDGPDRSENLYIMFALIAVIFVTAGFSFYQEGQASMVMKSFLDMIPTTAEVIRNGSPVTILVKDVVVGDVVVLKGGDQVPADIRVIESHGLKVDNSAVTGESKPIEKDAQISEEFYLEARNLMFSATSIVEGRGKGIIIRVGDQTVMGQIVQLTGNIKDGQTTLGADLQLFMKIIAIWSICLGATFFCIMISLGFKWEAAMAFVITTVVSSVPEGLLATLTLSLTLAAKRMAKRNCLVKNLEAVESLGTTSLICTDKTGTLTQNRMTVTHAWHDHKVLSAASNHLVVIERKKVSFRKLCRCAILCSTAEFKAFTRIVPVMKREIIGDASEAAILRFVEMATRGGVGPMRTRYPKVFEIPFNSTNKFQLSIHAKGVRHVLVMKGAPEKIIAKCSTILGEKEVSELTADVVDIIQEACTNFASAGKRVLAFCDKENYPYSKDDFIEPETGLRFLGLLAMVDPPRPNVPEAVLTCRKAGVRVIMVTGDHAKTAQSIARQVHIISDFSNVQIGIPDDLLNDYSEKQAIILEGSHLSTLTPDELDNIILTYEEIVFARTSPKQKLDIVECCQRVGNIVAVTGDGVNDSPALKKADIGVSMGITGSAVSKHAAEIILLDDNFASVTHGIEEGRLVFDNLKKSISYTLTHNLPEFIPYILHICVGIPLPLTVIEILVIDLVTDLYPAIAFAYAQAEGDLMLQRPRNVTTQHLVAFPLLFVVGQLSLIETASGMFTYFLCMAKEGWTPSHLIGIRKNWEDQAVNMTDSYERVWNHKQRMELQQTCNGAVFLALVVCQVANTVVCSSLRYTTCQRKFENVYLRNASAISLAIAFILINVPGIYEIVGTRPLQFYMWLTPIPFCLYMICFDSLRKIWAQKNPNHWLSQNLII